MNQSFVIPIAMKAVEQSAEDRARMAGRITAAAMSVVEIVLKAPAPEQESIFDVAKAMLAAHYAAIGHQQTENLQSMMSGIGIPKEHTDPAPWLKDELEKE